MPATVTGSVSKHVATQSLNRGLKNILESKKETNKN